jgi:energy-coupling factor transporter transmembrane protein EcfT
LKLKKALIALAIGLFLVSTFVFMIPIFVIIFSITILIFGVIFCVNPKIVKPKIIQKIIYIRFIGLVFILIGGVFLLGGDTLFATFYDHNDQSKYIISNPPPPDDLPVSKKKDPDFEPCPGSTQNLKNHFKSFHSQSIQP